MVRIEKENVGVVRIADQGRCVSLKEALEEEGNSELVLGKGGDETGSRERRQRGRCM